ncbi:tRNA pseudouridine(38-40) synthase TruA [Helicobacter colisuis]|uniref:tRNA pseudouridine(38-40) synthase TruA n=1 Tax=Helicobacter colisuis TaxID=2949739 RepID=UPI002029C5F6|nr:tRNA pseudouridine(38-40) synthase TruA [Helicobacter colisuis]MCL9822541.1 tRNA pseudouridine(38-40) synthase TruA [Helicobacter colisuis]
MIKVAMRIAYYGGDFFGFQRQKDQVTICGVLEEVFRSIGIFDLCMGSGRTDKGVHASAQVISVDIPEFHRDFDRLKQLLNTKLYPRIKIKQIWQVESGFHARFSVKRRGYCYVLSQKYSPFWVLFSHFYPLKNPLLVQESLNAFRGIYDFGAFMKNGGSGCESSVREIFHAKLVKRGDFYLISFWGNGFLRSQIRLMVGFLLEIDKGNLRVEDLKRQLLGEKIFSVPAPSNGLFLSRVDY